MRVHHLIIVTLSLFTSIMSCQSSSEKGMDPDIYTGNMESYTLYQASDFAVNGIVVLNELKSGYTEVEVKITPTEKGLLHPVHIHFSSIEANGEIAVVLNPVDGETGISITELKEFEDGNAINYSELIDLDACVKVHLSSTPPDYHTLLVGGNIGAAPSKENPFARLEISVCK